MGQTSELDEEKSLPLVLPDATAKNADDISNRLCVGRRRMTHSHDCRGLSQDLLLGYVLLILQQEREGLNGGREGDDNEEYSQNEGGGGEE